MNLDKRIDEVLEKFYGDSVDAYHAFMGTYTDAESDETAPDRVIKRAKKDYKALIKEVVDEVVGEDKESDHQMSHRQGKADIKQSLERILNNGK